MGSKYSGPTLLELFFPNMSNKKLLVPFPLLFITSYSHPNHFNFPVHCLFISFDEEIYQNSKKDDFLLSISYVNYPFQAPDVLGKGVHHKSQQD